jgi:hypothetical protein
LLISAENAGDAMAVDARIKLAVMIDFLNTAISFKRLLKDSPPWPLGRHPEPSRFKLAWQ